MSDQEKINTLIADNDNLRLDKEYLQNVVTKQAAQIAELEAEKMLVVRTVIKTLASVGLWPLKKEDNLAKKAMKGIRDVLSAAVLDSNSLAKRFSFLEEVYPLCEKYKDLEV